MSTPTVNISTLKFTGNQLEVSGDLDLQGGTATFYLDPQPSGRPIGPFPLTVDGVAFAQSNIALGKGKWKVRIVINPASGNPLTVNSSELNVLRINARAIMPDGSNNTVSEPAPSGMSFGDTNTSWVYHSLVETANDGAKRVAAANAIIAAMSSAQRLDIFRNGVLVVRAEYDGTMSLDTSTSDVMVKLSTPVWVKTLVNADINTGIWTFDLQGGLNLSSTLHGTVGPVGSGKDIILSDSPSLTSGFGADFSLVVPALLDNL